MPRRVLSVLCLVSLWASAAKANTSRFQQAGIVAIPGGARVRLAYTNEWGSPELNAANSDVRLFLHRVRDNRAGFYVDVERRCAPNMSGLGVVTMLGSGTCTVDLDYRALGCSAGQQVWLHGRWVLSNHCWGEPWASRSAGGALTLP